MDVAAVEKIVGKVKSIIKREMQRERYEEALNMISSCGQMLYITNIRYTDSELEDWIKDISKAILQPTKCELDDNKLLFFDGFGLDNRGLAKIYLEAMCKFKQVIYVCYEDRKDQIPDTLGIINKYGSTSCFISRNDKLTAIDRLNQILQNEKPGLFFHYSTPDDVVATPVLYAYEGLIKRCIINLTDHAFWLGTGCVDKCVEFRDYGASISAHNRNIDKDKVEVILFYPIVNTEKSFDGYPFEIKEGQKVIFSGGALYKTIGENGKYYKLVGQILEKHSNVIFWYAGDGDDKGLKELSNAFPARVYHSTERKDLYQIMKHSCLYLSTYPISGGLMTQYAAYAGCVPLTLQSFEDNSDLLINYDSLNVEFADEKDLLAEADRLIEDEEYRFERSKIMEKSLVSKEGFESEVSKLLKGEKTSFDISFKHIHNEEQVANLYYGKMSLSDAYAALINKKVFKYMLLHMPVAAFLGGIKKLCR